MTKTLRLTGEVHIAPTADVLYDDLAKWLMAAANHAVDKRGVFHLALSGGTTPKPFYMRLVIDPTYRVIPWKQTHLWVVDERCVPESDEKSNFRMIREVLVDHVPVRRRQIHPMPVLADDADAQYDRELRSILGEEGRLDFVLLGMGLDGHTASLFAGSPALDESQRWVAVNEGPTVVPPPRLTMTYPLLNGAGIVGVLVTGAGKAPTIHRIDHQMRREGPEPQRLPITGVRPHNGKLSWFLDAKAAGG